MKSKLDICKHCGNGRGEHHIFEPFDVPAGCICDPRDWGDPTSVPPVCETFTPDDDGWCVVCTHDDKCHKQHAKDGQA